MTTNTYMAEDDKRLFELGSWVYPQPVAISCGRIVRSRSPESLVDAILKAAKLDIAPKNVVDTVEELQEMLPPPEGCR